LEYVVNLIKEIFNLLTSFGATGMFIIAILDSSLLSIPEVNDILVVGQCIKYPSAVLYYPLIAATGSVIGCLILFHIARRGGRVLLHRRFSSKNVEKVEAFYARYGVFALIVPALMPPPTPFKIFVASAGALQYPRARFIAAVLFGRFARYFSEGILAVLYGEIVLQYMREHPHIIGAIVLGAFIIGFLLYKLLVKLALKRAPVSSFGDRPFAKMAKDENC